MKKLVCAALCLGGMAAVGCTTDDGSVPTILFDWGSPNDCPDLSVAGREAAVIMNGVDRDGFAADEQLIFDCEDGNSGVIDLQAGFWDFDFEVVDQYTDEFDPFECFDEAANGADCLYYTTTASTVDGVDTLSFDPDVLINFSYGYGDITVDRTIDGNQEPSTATCGDFDPAEPAETFRISLTFYTDSFLDEDFLCVDDPVTTRDLPLGDYAVSLEMLDADGFALGDPAIPGAPDCPAGVCSLETHLENILILANFDSL